MNRQSTGFIILTLVIAVLLTIFALPMWLRWIWPDFVLLILIYWSLHIETRSGIFTAWIMGIILDIFGGTLLGEHALALTIVIYLIFKLQKQIRVFPLSQQAGVIFVASILYLAIVYWVQGAISAAPNSFLFWVPIVTNTLLWPWLSMWLQKFRTTR